MRIDFTKMSGAGNDFVLIDNRSGTISDGASLARRICDRRWGVGADGLLLLESSAKAHYRMVYYNADGSTGGMCGNGGRCIARYAIMNAIAPREHSFEALDFLYHASSDDSRISLSMKDPQTIRLKLKLRLQKKLLVCHSVDTGSPHAVVPVKNFGSRASLKGLDVDELGRGIRFHRKFSPLGTNVDFVEVLESNTLNLRTYERGVEAETLACGTGSVAAAVVAHLIWGMQPPVKIIPTSGVELTVGFDAHQGSVTGVTLSGPATVLFTGSLDA